MSRTPRTTQSFETMDPLIDTLISQAEAQKNESGAWTIELCEHDAERLVSALEATLEQAVAEGDLFQSGEIVELLRRIERVS